MNIYLAQACKEVCLPASRGTSMPDLQQPEMISTATNARVERQQVRVRYLCAVEGLPTPSGSLIDRDGRKCVFPSVVAMFLCQINVAGGFGAE